MTLQRIEVNVATGERSTVALSPAEIAAVEAYAASPEGIAAQMRAMESRLDRLVNDTARGMGYDSGLSCATYTASGNPTFAAEASAFIAWRDALWAAAIALLADVQAGTRAVPTEAELIAAMPVFTRPGA